VTAEDRYPTPAAFRRALTERLRQASKEGPWTPQHRWDRYGGVALPEGSCRLLDILDDALLDKHLGMAG
jgi:hypothetical protein